MPLTRCWPAVAYFTISTENHERKHLLGVFNSDEVVRPDADTNAVASYFVCDGLEKMGWQKLSHNHDLIKAGVVVKLRSGAILGVDGRTIDDSYVDLQRPQELLHKMLATLQKMGIAP